MLLMILRCINAGSCKLLTQNKLYYGELRDNDSCNTYYKIKRDDGSINSYRIYYYINVNIDNIYVSKGYNGIIINYYQSIYIISIISLKC